MSITKEKGYTTNGYIWLKNKIQDLIDNNQVAIGNIIAPPNQTLDLFNNLLPNHNVNQVDASMSFGLVYHE